MRIAVASTGPSLNSMISPTCTEASHIIYMDLLSGTFYAFEIPHTHPVDTKEFPIAESLMGAGVCAVLLQACRPDVQRTLQEGGIRVYTHISGRVSEGIERYKQGDLSPEPKLPIAMQTK